MKQVKQYPERTPTQWGNRYIGQLLSRLEELAGKPEIECPHCKRKVSLEDAPMNLPESVKKDIRTTIHACIASIAESRKKEQANETKHSKPDMA